MISESAREESETGTLLKLFGKFLELIARGLAILLRLLLGKKNQNKRKTIFSRGLFIFVQLF